MLLLIHSGGYIFEAIRSAIYFDCNATTEAHDVCAVCVAQLKGLCESYVID